MLARCATYVLEGVEARPVTVECDVRPGLPSFTILGLSDGAVREMRGTVRAAIQNAGYQYPQQRVTCNIGPAWLRRTSPSLTLALAVALLAATGQLPGDVIAQTAVYGDLSLSGEIRPLPGTIAAANAHRATRQSQPLLHGGRPLPHELVPAPAIPITHLSEVATLPLDRYYDVCTTSGRHASAGQPDFADVRGHEDAIFALTVAAAGGHHVLLRGAPGSGCTLLARRIPSILPELTETQQREVAAIHDAAGLGHARVRPFRAPHYTISAAGLVGGGTPIRPGEITLAHRGCLYLESLTDFSRSALEALRAPLADRSVTLVRGDRALRLPADFQLVASVTPCPCGQAGSERCTCEPDDLRRYQRRLSASLLDRIDIVIDLPSQVDPGASPSTTSAQLRDKVAAVRERQAHRDPAVHRDEVPDGIGRGILSDTAEQALDHAYRSGQLSVRGRIRTLRVAATIADLHGEDRIGADAVRTALSIGPNRLSPATQLA